MSGALAERVFAHKLLTVGFTNLSVVERRPFGIDDAARYPLFTPDLIEVMRRVVPVDRRDEVAVAVTVTATRPTSPDDE